MLKRAWYTFAVLWACLLTWLIFRADGKPAAMPVLIAYGPLAVPWIAPRFIGWLRHGVDYFRLRKVRRRP